MEFFDEAKIYIRSGEGGKGVVSFRREKYVPKGGPDGGTGGKGGDVIFKVNPQLSTLQDFKYQQHYNGEDGKQGGGSQKTGRSGRDCIIEVPLGTVIHDHELGIVLADLSDEDAHFVVARGGRGGRGNMEFTTSVNQAPTRAEDGEPAECFTLRLELKLLADVALVGFPNAGKSTLVSTISAATCKVGDYPFTTLKPQLGKVVLGENCGDPFVVADIPGLIEGAHKGKGLGLRFLRHIERSRVLWIVIEALPPQTASPTETEPSAAVPSDQPLLVYQTLCRELEEYDPELLSKPQMVLVTKMDVSPDKKNFKALSKDLKARQIPLHFISAVQNTGLKELLQATSTLVQKLRPKRQDEEVEATENPTAESN